MYFLETLSQINFELSSHCNSKCPQCGRYDIFGRTHKDLYITHLDVKVIKKLPLARMKNLKMVSFGGNFGDALMHPDLNEIMDFFQQQQISITTNALFLDNNAPAICDPIKPAPPVSRMVIEEESS